VLQASNVNGVGVGVGLIVGAGVGLDVGVGVGVVFGVGIGVGLGVGVIAGAADLLAVPFFQTSFLPDLVQVYLIPADFFIWPSFLQALPGFTAASTTERFSVRAKHPISMVANPRFIFPRIAIK
jgi:hypothetical protein